jgi:hypothetical protein
MSNPGDAHGARLLHHHDEVAEPGEIRVAGEARSHHSGHHRDPSRHADLVVPHLREVVAERIQVLGPRSPTVEEVHDRNPLLEGDLVDVVGLGVVDLALGPAHDGEVVVHHRHAPAVHLADADDHPVRRGLSVRDVRRLRELTELEKRSRIAEEIEPAARRELAEGLLPFDRAGARRVQRGCLAALELFDLFSHVHRATSVATGSIR